MAALAFLFKLRGEEDLTKVFMIRQVVKGFRRRGKEELGGDGRRPITLALLIELLNALEMDTACSSNIMPVCCFCFFLGCITAAGCYELVIVQTGEFTDNLTMHPWGTAQFGGIVTHSFHNASEGIVFTQSWSKGNLSDLEWKFIDMALMNYIYYCHKHAITSLQAAGVKGPFTAQILAGCFSDPETTKLTFYKLALDGEDLLHLDVDQGIWISSPSPLASRVREELSADKHAIKTIQVFLMGPCKLLANSLLFSGRPTLETRIQPEVFFVRRHRDSEDELICMVTGFYPEPINVTLWKNSKVEIGGFSTGTLPNADGTFQTVVRLTLAQDSELFCRVEHNSFEEPLMVPLEKSHHIPAGVTVGVGAGICFLVLGMAWLVIRYRQSRGYTTILGMNLDMNH
ncbi:antigen-presenting glycoprotein CD1d-like [Hyperolius riggenbachi]|uniref:antigen-presenting glycoprotein CD1d-like n=1 Tax=Hyperolius riggenbachi TaxID=752182 RepID=UPI0035A30EC3